MKRDLTGRSNQNTSRISKRVETRKVKEHEPKSRIKKHKKVALSLLILLIIGVAASYNLTKTKTNSPSLTTPSYTSIPKNKIPEIESLEYKEKVRRGELQEVKLVVNDENPTKAVLKLNNTVIDIPLYKIDNNKTIFSVSFDPKNTLKKKEKSTET
jgi:uncharacterized membrane protein